MAEGTALRELISLFRLGVDSEDLEKGTKKLEGFLGKVKKVGEVVAEAFSVNLVREFVAQQIEAAARVADLSERLGVGTQELQAFQFAARLGGVEAESAAHSLGFLNRSIGEALTGSKEAAGVFAKLGVRLKDSDGRVRELGDVVGDLADAFQAMPDQQTRAATAMKLFGREGQALLPVFAEGREGIEGLRKEFEELGGGMGDDFVRSAKKVDDELGKVDLGVRSLKTRIVGEMLPAVRWLVDRFKALVIGTIDITKHTNVLKTGMISLSVLAGGKLVSTLGGVLRALGLLKPTIGQTVAALWGFAKPALIVAALYLVFDELYTLMTGGKTVVGDALNEITGDSSAATKAALYLRAGWDDLVDTFKLFAVVIVASVLPVLQTLWYTVRGLGKVFGDIATGNFGAIADDIKAATQEISDAFSAGGKTISEEWKKNIGTSHLADVEKLLKGGQGPLNFEALSARAGGEAAGPAPYKPGFGVVGEANAAPARDFSPAALKRHQAFMARLKNPTPATAAAAPAASTTAPAAGVGQVIHQKNTFTTTVHTSSDQPKAVGEATGQGIATAQQKATNNALIAVRRP